MSELDKSKATVEEGTGKSVGRKFRVWEIATVSVPEEFKDKFLMFNNKTNKITYKELIPFTQAELDARKSARDKIRDQKNAEKIAKAKAKTEAYQKRVADNKAKAIAKKQATAKRIAERDALREAKLKEQLALIESRKKE